jgi:hypothetical protein
MRKVALVIAFMAAIGVLSVPAESHADDQLVCPYPLVGEAVRVNVGIEAGGKFCDGPTEINGVHYHCEAGGALVGGGGFGLAPINGFTFGGILGGGIGAGRSLCAWRCPDNTPGPAPNPPGAWKEYLVIRVANNSCIGHMAPAGPTSEPVQADQGPPGFQEPKVLPPLVPGPVMAEPPEPPEPQLPTVTNPGQGNPDDAP